MKPVKKERKNLFRFLVEAPLYYFFEMRFSLAQLISLVSLVVRDYDEAVRFFTEKLRFTLKEDTSLSDGKRWVIVSPSGSSGTSLLLAKASSSAQTDRIGDQTGGRVALFLQTDDFWGDYREMLASGVQFSESPREERYGTVVVFYDLYGNKWDLLQLHGTV